MKQRGISRYLAFLLFFIPFVSFSQEGATKLAEGVYAIKGPGTAINTGFVVGDRGVFVFACDLRNYDQRIQAIRSVAGGKPIRFVANGHHAGDAAARAGPLLRDHAESNPRDAGRGKICRRNQEKHPG